MKPGTIYGASGTAAAARSLPCTAAIRPLAKSSRPVTQPTGVRMDPMGVDETLILILAPRRAPSGLRSAQSEGSRPSRPLVRAPHSYRQLRHRIVAVTAIEGTRIFHGPPVDREAEPLNRQQRGTWITTELRGLQLGREFGAKALQHARWVRAHLGHRRIERTLAVIFSRH